MGVNLWLKDNLNGIVLGDFLKIDNKIWFENLIYEIAQELNIPVLGGFKITHRKNKLTIPLGINCSIKENILNFEY